MNTSSWETKHRRPILLIGAGLIALWYGVLFGAYVLVPALQREVQSRAADVLRSEFGSDVRFQSFDVTFLPRIRIVSSGVLTRPKLAFRVTIDQTVAEHALLEILPSTGQPPPLDFELATFGSRILDRPARPASAP